MHLFFCFFARRGSSDASVQLSPARRAARLRAVQRQRAALSAECDGPGHMSDDSLASGKFTLTIQMLRLLSSKAHGCKDFCIPSKPCHVGIHWIALTEYSQMSTHFARVSVIFIVFASFCIGQISHQLHKG